MTRVHKDRTWVKTMCASTCRKTRVSTCHLTRDSRCFIHVQAHACYTCEHVLATLASTLLVVRARLLFKNVRPGQLKINTLSLNDIARYATLCWRRPALARRARRSSTTYFLAREGLQPKKKISRASLVGIDRTRAPLPTWRLRTATK